MKSWSASTAARSPPAKDAEQLQLYQGPSCMEKYFLDNIDKRSPRPDSVRAGALARRVSTSVVTVRVGSRRPEI